MPRREKSCQGAKAKVWSVPCKHDIHSFYSYKFLKHPTVTKNPLGFESPSNTKMNTFQFVLVCLPQDKRQRRYANPPRCWHHQAWITSAPPMALALEKTVTFPSVRSHDPIQMPPSPGQNHHQSSQYPVKWDFCLHVQVCAVSWHQASVVPVTAYTQQIVMKHKHTFRDILVPTASTPTKQMPPSASQILAFGSK